MPSSGAPTARIAQLREADWEQFAHLRLRALAQTLGTAGEPYRSETRFTAAQWRQRLREHAQFAAFVTDRPAGLIAACRQSADVVYLYSLWVHPGVRGRGLARRLVAAVLDWARRQGATTVVLRTEPGNGAALAVYRSFGFTQSPAQTTGDEVVLALSLR